MPNLRSAHASQCAVAATDAVTYLWRHHGSTARGSLPAIWRHSSNMSKDLGRGSSHGRRDLQVASCCFFVTLERRAVTASRISCTSTLA